MRESAVVGIVVPCGTRGRFAKNPGGGTEGGRNGRKCGRTSTYAPVGKIFTNVQENLPPVPCYARRGELHSGRGDRRKREDRTIR